MATGYAAGRSVEADVTHRVAQAEDVDGTEVSRTLEDRFESLVDHTAGTVNVHSYGVTGAALVAAAAAATSAGAELVIAHSIAITTALGTLSCPVRTIGAGKFVTATGGSVTLAGPFVSDLSHRFDTSAGGTITFSAQCPEVYPQWWGAKGDGVTDDTAALAAWAVPVAAGRVGAIPKGEYLTNTGLRFTAAVEIRGFAGSRISTTDSAPAVLELDFSGSGSGWGYGSVIRDLVLDGKGHAADGLLLKGVISATFDDLRATNVTVAGFHLAWAQCCQFNNPTCSRNVEAFTTVPVYGLLADTASSSANTVVNPCFEHVSGAGIRGISLTNTWILNGTSEGNDIGIDFGETVVGALTCSGNTVSGIDLEVNATSDVVLRATAQCNHFLALNAGNESPEVQILGGIANGFSGGWTGGFVLDSASHDNYVLGVKLLGTGRTVTDAGVGNTVRDVYNMSTGTRVARSLGPRRMAYNPAAGGTVAVDAALTDFVAVSATGATATVAIPTHPADGQELDVTIHNRSGGALTITWATGDQGFQIAGWVDPANGTNRSVRWRYDANYARWYPVSITPADVPDW